MKIVKINSGWFKIAGVKYKWLEDKHDIRGVGLKMVELEKPQHFEIHIDGQRFYLNSKDGLAFVKKYNSIYQAGETNIGVVSRSILRQIGE